MPIVCESLRFCFVSNPKAASTSVAAGLARYQEFPELVRVHRPGYYTRNHIPACELRDRMGASIWASYYSFAIVREITDWFVSQVAYNTAKNGLEADLASPLDDADVVRCWRWLRRARGQHASASATQWAFVCDEHQTPLVSELWRMDALPRAWPEIRDRLGVSPSIELQQLNSSSHPSAADWLTARAAAKVRDLYAVDAGLYDIARS